MQFARKSFISKSFKSKRLSRSFSTRDSVEDPRSSAGAATPTLQQPSQFPRLDIPLDPIVQVYNTTHVFNCFQPWQRHSQSQSTGSGFAISGKRILTNAHVIAYNSSVQVRKPNTARKYNAKVEAFNPWCDTAILKVEDEDFWKNLTPLKIGGLIEPQDTCIIAGYPIGGDNISVSPGTISRLYMSSCLQSEINIAVNPGNSGGPVIKDRDVVGIVFAQNVQRKVSYMVPSPVINHFLESIEKRGKFDIVEAGFVGQKMENKQLRDMFGMTPDQTGILINRIKENSSSSGSLKRYDVILEVDGKPIADDGSIDFGKYGRLNWTYEISLKYPGDKTNFKIIRDKKIQDVTITLKPQEPLIIPEFLDKSTYYIHAGLTFVPLSAAYASQWKVPPHHLAEKYNINLNTKRFPDEEIVLISEVLPHEINTTYDHFRDLQVLKVNGVDVKNLKHLAHLIDTNDKPFLNLELESDWVLGFHTEQARSATKDILSQLGLQRDRSSDI